jgi:class 3 adenylate cyclase
MGDGLLVYFGYPQAHEDNAEQAVRAGLELTAAIGTLRSSTSLQIRVGIATGMVVVGELIGSEDAHEREIVGKTPNLAARLQSRIARFHAAGDRDDAVARIPARAQPRDTLNDSALTSRRAA